METSFELHPLPLEKEFQVQAASLRLHELSREELETMLGESLLLITKMAHQLRQMKDHLAGINLKSDDSDASRPIQ